MMLSCPARHACDSISTPIRICPMRIVEGQTSERRVRLNIPDASEVEFDPIDGVGHPCGREAMLAINDQMPGRRALDQ